MRDALSVAVRETMLIAHQRLTAATPVDTTHAASNWLLSISRPNFAIAGSRQNVDWGPYHAGRDLIAAYHVRMGKIYLRNNVPYIRALNNGHSQQAPPGFVQKALAGGATRMPRGTRRDAAKMLRGLGDAAIKKRRTKR